MAKRQPLPDVLGNILTERLTGSTSNITPESQNTSVTALHNTAVTEESQTISYVSTRSEDSMPFLEDESNSGKTKATFYLSREITQALEDTWIHLRRRSGKGRPASKSILVEAALRRTLDVLKENGIDFTRNT